MRYSKLRADHVFMEIIVGSRLGNDVIGSTGSVISELSS